MRCLAVSPQSYHIATSWFNWKCASNCVFTIHMLCTLASQLAAKPNQAISFYHNYSTLRYFTWNYGNVTNPMLIICVCLARRLLPGTHSLFPALFCLLFLSVLTPMHAWYSVTIFHFDSTACIGSKWITIQYQRLKCIERKNWHALQTLSAINKWKRQAKNNPELIVVQRNSLAGHLNNNYIIAERPYEMKYLDHTFETIANDPMLKLCLRKHWLNCLCVIDDFIACKITTTVIR